MNDHLIESQRYWDQHAESDPLWTVLAFPDKSGGRWTLQEFMKTGEREIALLFHRLAALQIEQPARRALDFGCGVGRLTQALARRVEGAVGADISPVMIELAGKLNRYPNNADYICTAHTGLESLPAQSFQLIYSNIVLQHVLPDVAVSYLHEFFRLLEPDGLLVFQLPSHRDSAVEAEIKSMPDEAYRAGIELAAALPPSVAASSELSVALKVRNASQHAWQQPFVGPLAVGNHWLDAGGELMLVQDDGRAPLLQIVPAGLEWPVLMTIHAPAEPGKYVGEIDLVHEGITWYGHRGSPTLRFTIEVTRNSAVTNTNARPAMMSEYPVPDYPQDVLPKWSRTSAPPPQANFPMHGVPRDTVMDLIKEYGGRLAYLEEDRRAGPEWVSYRYFVVGKR
jgi:SAM-dependent methyltransferase